MGLVNLFVLDAVLCCAGGSGPNLCEPKFEIAFRFSSESWPEFRRQRAFYKIIVLTTKAQVVPLRKKTQNVQT